MHSTGAPEVDRQGGVHDTTGDAITEDDYNAFAWRCLGWRWEPGLALSFSSAIVVAALMPVIENFWPPAVGLTIMEISLMA